MLNFRIESMTDGETCVFNGDNRVCQLSEDCTEEEAHALIHYVNYHDALVEALRAMVDSPIQPVPGYCAEVQTAQIAARATLAALESGGAA